MAQSDAPPNAASPAAHASAQAPRGGSLDAAQDASTGRRPDPAPRQTPESDPAPPRRAEADAGSGNGAPPERTVLDDRAIRRALMRIAHEIVEGTEDPSLLYLIAIPNGGVPLGRILVDHLESLTDERPPLGILDTTLYRDDLTSRGSRPRLRRTEMPSSVDDRVVVLVEDVVNTGRTIRAAMDALMDFGRPSQVRVVALVDRGHRELPIKIDYVGKNIPTHPQEKVIFRRRDRVEEPDGGAGGDVLGGEEGELELVVRGGTDS